MEIISAAMAKLTAHPENPNRMSKANFAKLAANIQATGRYEPIIVRRDPGKKGFYQIINGHHRKMALEKAGATAVDCVIWDVDNEEARILLTTLNRLTGSDDLGKKTEIIKKLRKKFSAEKLAKILPQTKTQIEKLNCITRPTLQKSSQPKCFLGPLVFFMTDKQKKIIDRVLPMAKKGLKEKTNAEKNSAALVKMAEAFEATQI